MTWILIVGSGTGTRFGSEIPKQFLDLAGIPVIAWSILAFKRALPKASLVLTIPKGKAYQQLAKERLSRFRDFCEGIVEGGAHRQESVIKGLKWIHNDCNDCKVLIHDGVRPFVNVDLIKRVHKQIERGKAVVPTIQPPESVRIQTGNVNQPINRELVHLVQTPQGFYLQDLLTKLDELSETYSTDEASLFGPRVNIVEGDRRNIKITFPEDLIIAKAMISAGLIEKPDVV
ncbi:MAG: 2-C-methyl-D-erythritol 4-phosphate cytidylyltransferase [Chlorobi bacterium]|nr:2-C-methyl-D-erythritol 4-phosphate cytidylyltransferase [Chlorobiota bacterium]